MKINEADKLDFDLPDDFRSKFIEKTERFNIYKITYRYRTKRNNERENYKYMISNDNVRADFIDYINQYNRMYSYRSISNVKILDVELLGTVTK